MKYICNPMNLEYTYHFQRYLKGHGEYCVFREAADPSLVSFRGVYYLFPSMTGGFYTSADLEKWEFHEFLSDMPIYDYAPDVRVLGEYLYFCASRDDADCSFFRTRDPLREPFEEIEGTFPFWDPNLFCDDDGRLYFYWGCSNVNPIYGVELDPMTMRPLTEPRAVIDSHTDDIGYERNGEDHITADNAHEMETQLESTIKMMLELPLEQREKMGYGVTEEELRECFKKVMSGRPFMEGAWMTKYEGKYYLQYACPGTENNIYCDGCYVGEEPLGPFTLASNNPYSYKPGGFITGAGHGSTLIDPFGRGWHVSTMRIIQNYRFERRLGLWKAGIDRDGNLYCDQTYGDWPMNLEKEAFEKPDFMLISYKKAVKCSSGTGAENVTDEEIRSFWKADTNSAGEWVEVDLGNIYDVHAVQVNFADNELKAPLPEGVKPMESAYEIRYMDRKKQCTRWFLEVSPDGRDYTMLADKRKTDMDLPHDLVVREEGVKGRYVRLTVEELPYRQIPCVSGLRVFGRGDGELPEMVETVNCRRVGELDVELEWESVNAVGFQVLWGSEPDKLYHSRQVLGAGRTHIGAFIRGKKAYARVDAFNESGITEGKIFQIWGDYENEVDG